MCLASFYVLNVFSFFSVFSFLPKDYFGKFFGRKDTCQYNFCLRISALKFKAVLTVRMSKILIFSPLTLKICWGGPVPGGSSDLIHTLKYWFSFFAKNQFLRLIYLYRPYYDNSNQSTDRTLAHGNNYHQGKTNMNCKTRQCDLTRIFYLIF